MSHLVRVTPLALSLALVATACAHHPAPEAEKAAKAATDAVKTATTAATPEVKKAAAALVPPHFAEGNAQLVEVPLAGSAEVAIRVMFYTGSIDDPAGKEGLTALTALLMAQGGTKKLSYPEILRALYPLATEISVNVDKEETVFSGRVHVDHVARFVPILADVLKEPRLPQADFERIRADMVNDIEKRLRATDDENLGKELLGLMLYPKAHPYGHYDGGTVKGLRAITLDDVKAHAAKVFGKRRMVIGIAGAVDQKTRDVLQAALAGLPEGAARVAEIPRVAKPAKPEVVIAEKPGKAVAISIGYTHDAFRGHPDFSELGLVQSYFGEHRQFHGVLMNEMREKRGLNYGDYAYVEKFIQEGWSRNVETNIARRQQHFEIWIRPVDPKDAVFATRLALFFLERLTKEGVPEQGVEDTRRFLEGYTRLWDLTPSRKLGYALDDQFYGVKDYLAGYRKDLQGMTAADVKGAIDRNLTAWPVKIAMVAPNAAELKAALVAGAKSEKTYTGQVDPSVLELDKVVSVFPLKLTADDIRVVKADELFVE